MDPQEFIAVALEIFLARERQKIRLMKESMRADQVALQEKERECSMLMRKNQDMLAKEAAKKKLVDDFMAFIGANENNENAQKFDDKIMMKAIETVMTSCGGDNGGFANGYGDTSFPGIYLGLEEKTTINEIVALVNKIGSCGGDDGGFSSNHGEINNAPEKGQNLGEEATKTAANGTNEEGD
ncbi:uncharacterized protein LOC111295196 [Durio zibethinus]|uniref:Uncharacterized protein LOC111295196 n=1 Tax=Durio zibethinus TaxID=66656 RepID=A0A6P5YUR1_DURZI|nr:uncharacterized protein LOC111295196 [Durio zibethinus]